VEREPPPLGFIVAFLRWALWWRHTLLGASDAHAYEIMHISESQLGRLNELAAVSNADHQLLQELDATRRQQLAKLALFEEADGIQAAITTLGCAIENAMYVLLRHIEHFRTTAATPSRRALPDPQADRLCRSISQAFGNIHGDQRSIIEMLAKLEQESPQPTAIQHFQRALYKYLQLQSPQ
jgi:hypothetical protein